MTTLREAAKAVLDCWDSPKWGWAPSSPTADLMAVLRAALEQPEQEPVAWMFGDGTWTRIKAMAVDHPPTIPVYTHPPQRKPLTDEQIEELDDQVRQVTIDKGSPVGWFAMQLARAIEQAHGIKEKP